MSVRLPADLLQRSAEEGARLAALSHLDEIARAERRLVETDDREALHDFRVGLRRLRSCLRSYRATLEGSVSKKMRSRLRKLTLATNADRDSQVHLAWLRQQAGKLEAGEGEGLAWLIGRLEGRQFDRKDEATSKIPARFVKVGNKLRPRLETFELMVRTEPGKPRRSFGGVTGDLVVSQVAQLRQQLELVHTPENKAEAHTARIAGKRLRYLMEPLGRRVPGVKGLVLRLKQLQDVLGDLHDMQVLRSEIESSLEALQKIHPPSSAVPGLVALLRLVDQQAGLAFGIFQHHWAGGHSERFLARATEVGQKLSVDALVGASGTAKPSDRPVITHQAHPRAAAISVVR